MLPQWTSINIVVTKFKCSSSSTVVIDRQILGYWCEHIGTKNTDLEVLLKQSFKLLWVSIFYLDQNISRYMYLWYVGTPVFFSWGAVNIHVEKKKTAKPLWNSRMFQLLNITFGKFYCSHFSPPWPTFGPSNKTKVNCNP